MKATRLLPGVVHEVVFHNHSSHLKLMDEAADSILLFMGMRASENAIVVNDFIAGSWGVEILIPIPHLDDYGSKLYFKFNGTALEIWNVIAAITLSRFDRAKASATKLVHSQGVTNPTSSLEFRLISPEGMVAEVSNRLLSKRLEIVERLLSKD